MKTTIGVFSTHVDAEKALNELRAFGVSEADMSYVYKNMEGDMIDNQTTDKVGDGAANGVATGTVVGALAGLVAANIVLPGFGTLIVSGPLVAALGFTGVAATAAAGATAGAVAGGLIGALTNVGVSDPDTTLYESFVHKGNILVVARTPLVNTKEVFIKTGAIEIREYSQE